MLKGTREARKGRHTRNERPKAGYEVAKKQERTLVGGIGRNNAKKRYFVQRYNKKRKYGIQSPQIREVKKLH